jgi:DNA-directed RNA polymerase specialized sigma24 family protein
MALVLLQVRELPGEVIAEMLGVPLGTVYSRAFAARRRLAELLGACAPNPVTTEGR